MVRRILGYSGKHTTITYHYDLGGFGGLLRIRGGKAYQQRGYDIGEWTAISRSRAAHILKGARIA